MRIVQTFLFSMVVVLLVLLAFMGRSLWVQLDELSTAGNENAQWTIQQLDAELSTLYATLLEQRSLPALDEGAVRVRAEIALSRIALVRRGISGEILSDLEEAEPLMTSLHHYASAVAAILDEDQSITSGDLSRLITLTTEIRPMARQIALLGIAEGAQRTEASRSGFRSNLFVFGSIALVVIALLTISLLVVNHLLSSARRQSVALKLSGARLKSTIAASLDAVIVTDENLNVLDINPAAERIFRCSSKAAIGCNFFETFLPNEPNAANRIEVTAPVENDLPRIISSGLVEMTATRFSKQDFPAEVNFSTVIERPDRLNVIYVRDISDRKLAESRLLEAKNRAEQTDRAKSRFLTVMSHEMRTPLNGILGVNDLLRRTPLTDQQLHYLDLASASGEILLQLVNEALDITRAESGSMAIKSSQFNPAQSIRRLVDVLAPLAREKGLFIELSVCPSAFGTFVADETRITQIITNLIGNAIKFTEAGGIKVSLQCVRSEGAAMAKISVWDSGKGISKDELEVIFDEYVAIAKPDGRQNRGDGLGLSISRKIARLMGGDLSVESKPGVGSTFSLVVPLEVESAGSDVPALSNEDRNVKTERRILIVDDSAVNRSVLAEMLVFSGHCVDEAANGLEAITQTSAREYDLILMDINMPGLDGIKTTKRIRRSKGPNERTHIQGLTAYDPADFAEVAVEAGMNGLSGKPIRLAVLNDLISTIEQTSSPGGARLLDKSVIHELNAVLGSYVMREKLVAFFQEAFIDLKRIRERPQMENWGEIGSSLHKLQGAASMFGFIGLERRLAAAGEAAEGEDEPSFVAEVLSAETVLDQTRDEVHGIMLVASELEPQKKPAIL
ncbi:hybrid sensor histidine kinase/response regulator [Ovoidimarina sediminis]|uniref:hybrid sensor histidine kinase/response regulator n=1 Tax=Ovoidimarina sediminis TaxID=3079856 RepID=UPI0029309B3D|nr:ATP-binding protein [Rhodophyticola sp. MJ-SS7]